MDVTPAAAEARLSQLESQLRRTQAILAVVGLIGCAGVIAHFLPGPTTLKAQRMVLVDERGNLRGEWTASASGDACIRLNNTAGKARMMWWLGHDGANVLELSDEQGVGRLELGWGTNGTPFLALAGADGHTRTRVTVFETPDRPAISVFDPENRRRWTEPAGAGAR